MSSEDQDLAGSLAPLSLPTLSPADFQTGSLPASWRGISSQQDGSQPSLSQQAAQLYSESQFETMGQGVGAQLPAVAELVLPPTASSFPLKTTQPVGRAQAGPAPIFLPGNFVLDAGAAMLAPPPRHPSVCKAEHRNSKAARRGPMDEMRQLVRILVKLMPNSSRFLAVTDEGGGGNRVKEEHIKDYLNRVLGRGQQSIDDAPPYPEWGLLSGWAAYISQLFSWASDKIITQEQAIRCARRLPGRSWETMPEELEKLRLCPQVWPLPLRKDAVRKVQKDYEETGMLPQQLPLQQLQPPQVQPPQVQPPHFLPQQLLLQQQPTMPQPTVMQGQVLAADGKRLAPVAVGTGAAAAGSDLHGMDADGGAKQPPAVSGGPVQPAQLHPASATVDPASYGQAPLVQPAFGTAAGAAPAAYFQSQTGPAAKRRRKGVDIMEVSVAEYSELEIYHLVRKLLSEAVPKRNTTPPDKIADLQVTYDAISRMINSYTPGVGLAVASSAAGQMAPALALAAAPGYPAGVAPLGHHAATLASAGAQASWTGIDVAAQVKAMLPPGPLNVHLAGVSGNSVVRPPGAVAAPSGPQVIQALQQAGQALPFPGLGKATPQQLLLATKPQGAPGQLKPSTAGGQAPVQGTGAVSASTQQPSSALPQVTAASNASAEPEPPQASSAAPASMLAPQSNQQRQPQSTQLPPPQPLPPQPPPPQPPPQSKSQASTPSTVSVPGNPAAASGEGSQGGGSVARAVECGVTVPAADAAALPPVEPTNAEGGKDTAGNPGNVRVGSHSGAFKVYGESGLFTLAVVAMAESERGTKRGGGGQEDAEAECHAPAASQAAVQHRATEKRGGAAAPHWNTDKWSRPKNRQSTYSPLAASEEMDETETKGRSMSMPGAAPAESAAEVDGPPEAAQPESICGPLRKRANELRTRLHHHMDQEVQHVEERQQQQQQHVTPSQGPVTPAAAPSAATPVGTQAATQDTGTGNALTATAAAAVAAAAATQSVAVARPPALATANVMQLVSLPSSQTMQVGSLIAMTPESLAALAQGQYLPVPYGSQLGLSQLSQTFVGAQQMAVQLGTQPMAVTRPNLPGQVPGTTMYMLVTPQGSVALPPGVQLSMPSLPPPSALPPQ